MNKKNILTFAVAMVLVAALSVGGTLAYLTATDEKVENEFTFGKMTVKLEEPLPTPGPDSDLPEGVDVNKDGKGNVYTNILPGQTLPKNPQVSTVTTTPAWLFIKVSGASKDVMPSNDQGDISSNPILANGWTISKDGTAATYYNGIYYKAVTSTDNDKAMDVFTHVKVSDDATGAAGNPSSIVIEVFEIQQSDVSLNDAKAKAEAHFNGTPTTP